MIGEQIKALRLARNMSQVELAKALNVSKQSVSNWENNNILPSIEIIKQLARFFSCTSDYLLEFNAIQLSIISVVFCHREPLFFMPKNFKNITKNS